MVHGRMRRSQCGCRGKRTIPCVHREECTEVRDISTSRIYHPHIMPGTITNVFKHILNRRKLIISLSAVVLPALLFYGVAVLVLQHSGFSLREILRDPAQQSGASSFLGFVSNIGVWLWVSSFAICCYSLITRGSGVTRGRVELLILLALLSLLLAVDDFFLLHERYVYQKGIFLFYAVCALTLFVRHFRRIIETDGFSFMFAGLLLASSIIIDMEQRHLPFDYKYVQLVEEGCKFIGAALWLFFCGRVGSAPESAIAQPELVDLSTAGPVG